MSKARYLFKPSYYLLALTLVGCGGMEASNKVVKTSNNATIEGQVAAKEEAADRLQVAAQALLPELNRVSQAGTTGDLEAQYEHARSQFALTRQQAVKFSDVKRWESVGEHYAVGYNAANQQIAIYDLSWQNPVAMASIGRMIMGTIGVGDLNLRNLVKLIKEQMADARARREAGLAGSDDATANPADEEFEKFYTEQEGQITEAVDAADTAHGDQVIDFQEGWWNDVKWKPSLGLTAQNQKSGPQAFTLSDVDWDEQLSTTEAWKFDRAMRKVAEVIGGAVDRDDVSQEEVMTMFQYEKRRDGRGFDLVMNEQGLALTNVRSLQNRPTKVIDLVAYQHTLGMAFLRLMLDTALTSLAGAVPGPAGALISYAVNRWMNLYNQQIAFHRYQALELIKEAPNGTFNFMDAEIRDKAAIHVLSNDSDFLTMLFKRRNAKFWETTQAREEALALKNTFWAETHGLTLNPLAASFVFGDDAKHGNRIFALGSAHRLTKRPYALLNYDKPHLIRVQRNLALGVRDLLVAVPVPVPFLKNVIGLIYSELVVKDIDSAMRWDARLVAQLKEEQGFDKEIGLLYNQRVNPFEMTLDEELEFIPRSRAELGL